MKISPDKRTELNMRKLLLWLWGSPVSGHGPSTGLIKSAHFPSLSLPGSALLTRGFPLKKGKDSAHRAAPAAVGMGTGPLGLQARGGVRGQSLARPTMPMLPARCHGPHCPSLCAIPSPGVPGRQGEIKIARQLGGTPCF